jgi:hypothetical protein
MAEIFISPLADNLELVIDCEGNDELLDKCHKNVLPDKYGLSHRIQDISIMGNNLRTIGKLTTVGDTIRSIVIPHGVTNIGNWCISNCPNLTSIIIPDTVTSIGDYFLSECTSLTSIVIPQGVTDIGKGFLNGCTSLTFISIPHGVTVIRDYFL